nr:salicylic acid methyltransferase [Lantana camara]
MEVVQVLHMNGGLGDTSYANNSLVQREVISMTRPVTEEAITELYTNTDTNTFCIAELGCSSGPNTLFVAAELIKLIHILARKNGHQLPDFQIQLNDLPGTDFNSIFQSLLPRFRDELSQDMGPGFGPCFVSGVPGSFYGRLFKAKSIHFVHSSYSLMWLSKVPEGLEQNKADIYMSATSPATVIGAYYEQFRRDFSTFLKCRSEEVVDGGRMVLTLLGRKGENASSKECCYIWELLALSLKEMVDEGLIEEEKLHSFHTPQYTPSPAEVRKEVEKEGSFAINHLQATEVTWAACGNAFHSAGGDSSYNVAKCMRSVAEPLLVGHFGDSIIDPVFEKYRQILSDRMSKEDTKFVNVTVSLTRMAQI